MRNKNYVGSHFGGGLFTMTDPFYMVALKNILGESYLVWDKAATIEFLQPGRATVYAEFKITDAQLTQIYAKTAEGEKFEPVYHVDVVDAERRLIARVQKTLYIRKRLIRPDAVAADVDASPGSDASLS